MTGRQCRDRAGQTVTVTALAQQNIDDKERFSDAAARQEWMRHYVVGELI